MADICPPDLGKMSNQQRDAHLAKAFGETSLPSLCLKLGKDRRLTEIKNELQQGIQSVNNGNRRASRSKNPITGTSITEILDVSDNRTLLLQRDGIDNWTASEHCARGVLRVILESGHPIFKNRYVDVETCWAARLCVSMWKDDLYQASQRAKHDNQSTTEIATQAPGSFPLVLSVPNRRLDQLKKTGRFEPRKRRGRPPKRETLAQQQEDNANDTSIGQYLTASSSTSHHHSRETLKKEFDDTRKKVRSLQATRARAKLQDGITKDKLQGKNIVLNEREVELRRLEVEVQTTRGECEQAQRERHSAEAELTQVEREPELTTQLEALKQQMVDFYEEGHA